MKPTEKAAKVLFSPIPVSRDRAVGLSERISALTSLASAAEYLHQRRELRAGGLNDWSVIRDGYAHASPRTRRLLDLVADRRVTTALYGARVVVSAGLLMPGNGRWRGAGSLFLAASGAALYPRHLYGTDGSDQATTLVQTGNGLARLARRPETKDAVIWHTALQSNLSYVVSGWYKLLGPTWRDASALRGVLRTRSYGHEPAFRLVSGHPGTTRLLVHGVLALECLFPLPYLTGGRLVRPFIAGAVGFHVANGFALGLGRFLTGFTSMHPLVAYTSAPRTHPAVADRDDRAPAATAALLAAAGVVAAATAARRRTRVRRGDPGARSLTTRHGNRLRYRLTGADAGGPVLVCVTGLAAMTEQFAWLAERAGRDGRFGVLVYDRAGYGASTRRNARPYRLAESVDELADLVAGAVPAHREVVLVGHSLGGELVRAAAAGPLRDRLRAVVYLDPSHPAELRRSERQRETAERFHEALASMSWSLRLGLGVLMARPRWVSELPPAARQSAFDQYADARLWDAARREWAAVRAEFAAHPGVLPRVPVPALVLSAQQTVDRDPEQLLLHHELAEAHRCDGTAVATAVVEGSDHDSLMTNVTYASEAAARIMEFAVETAAPPPVPGTSGTAARGAPGPGGR